MDRSIRHGAFALALAASLVGPAIATAAPSDKAEIRALEDHFAAAFRAKNLDAVMSAYAPDVFVFDAAPPRQYAGAEAYRKDWSDLFGSFNGPISFEINDLTIDTAGSFAFSHSIQHVSGQGVNGQPTDFTVRVTDVYRKTPTGWRIVQEHVSFPVDLATGKADIQSKP